MTANIRHSSENSEFLTPQWLTDWAHHVMGGIDLDPATSDEANHTVRASTICTKRMNGLFKEWHGRTFLNPPGGLVDEAGCAVIRKSRRRPGCTVSGACGLPPGHKHEGVKSSAVLWWHKLMHEFEAGRVSCAVFVGFSLELLQSAQGIAGKQPLDFPCSFPKQRIRFETEVDGVRVPGDQPTHANVIVLVCRSIEQASPGYNYESPSQEAERVDVSGKINRFIKTFSQIGYVHVPRGF